MGQRSAALLSAPAVLLVALAAALLGGEGLCAPGQAGPSGALSPAATDRVPAPIARIYRAAARRWDLDVAFLASIGAQETDHGRHPQTRRVNAAGCVGVMQLGVGGRCGDFWGRNKCDGNRDGRMDVLDAWDNICAAARGLRREKGAPPAGGSQDGYYQAACAYYGACADGAANYAAQVMARAQQYGFVGGAPTADLALAGASCADAGVPVVAGAGDVVVDPGANRAGAPLSPDLLGFVARMAEFLPRPPIITTGTNHAPLTSRGTVSDHWSGNGADFGSIRNRFPIGGGYGDQIAAAGLLVAGESPARARILAARGGTFTVERGGLRLQIIWKAADHFDHVHVGVRRLQAV